MSFDDFAKRIEDCGGEDDRCEKCGSLLKIEVQEFYVKHSDSPARFVLISCTNKECVDNKITRRRPL